MTTSKYEAIRSELKKAHIIIRNALAIMNFEQKTIWAAVNNDAGVVDHGITRANEREAALNMRDEGEPAQAVLDKPARVGGINFLTGVSTAHVIHHAQRRYEWQQEQRDSEQPAQALTDAARDVLAERQRQIEQKGWTPEHDDQHREYTLSGAAACYAAHTLAYPEGDPPSFWPFHQSWWKPSEDIRRNWIKAAALLLAEIERHDRATEARAKGGE